MKRMGKSIRDAEYVDEINMLRWRTALSTESKNRVFVVKDQQICGFLSDRKVLNLRSQRISEADS